MSEGPKTSKPRGRPPKKATESGVPVEESSTSSSRRITRLSAKLNEKSTVTPQKTASRLRPLSEKVFHDTSSDSEEKKEETFPKSTSSSKKSILMSPRAALAEEIEELSLSGRRSRAGKTNLKSKLTSVQKRTPEKKARSSSPQSSTPEKKMKKTPKKALETSCESSEELEVEQRTAEESGALKGRNHEYLSLQSWILESKTKKTSLSIYVSGQPGTGKTATTLRVLKSLGSAVSSCVVNCASTNTKSALFRTIFGSLNLDGKPTIETFEEHVKRFKKPLVLVLDEIDHLASRKNAALYAAFQWPDTLSYKIIILGIANSIDLTERLLPKLMLAKPPQRLVFEPYTKDDIVEILNDKMKKEEADVDSKAIELTARKVAAMSGDLRTALHIFKQQKSRLMPSDTDVPKTPSNGCREVLGIINNVYSSPLARARLPLQPRILLAVSLALSSNKSCSFDRNSLLRSYYKACAAIKVPALDDDELHSAFQTLESQSFVRQLNGGKLVLQVDAPTAKSAISDNAMLDQIALVRF